MRIGDELTVKNHYYSRNYSRLNNILKEGEILTVYGIKSDTIILSKRKLLYAFNLYEDSDSYIWKYFDINELRLNKLNKLKDEILRRKCT